MINLLKQDLARYTMIAGLLGLTLLGLYLFIRMHLRRAITGTMTGSAGARQVALPTNDTERIIVDPRKHTLTVVKENLTPGGKPSVTTTTLPDRQSTVDIHKDGSVAVTAPQLGIELRPFLGVGYSDDARLAIGADVLYWKRLDLGLGVQPNFHMADARGFLSLSYNLVDNLRITATIDHKKTPGIFLSARF